MSVVKNPKFKGTFFRYDVGLVDQVVDVKEDPRTTASVQPSQQHLDNWIVFANSSSPQVGELSKVEILEVKLEGQSFDGTDFTVSDGTNAGAYVIKARLTYTVQDAAAPVQKIHNLRVPLAATSSVVGTAELFGQRYVSATTAGAGVLPAASAAEVYPTGVATDLKISIAIAQVGDTTANPAVPAPSGVSIDTTGLKPELSFVHGIVQDGFSTRLNYVAQGDPLPAVEATLSFTPGAAASNQLASVSNFEIKSVDLQGNLAPNAITPTQIDFTASAAYVVADIDGVLAGATAEAAGDPVHFSNAEFKIESAVVIQDVTQLGRNFAKIVPNGGIQFSASITTGVSGTGPVAINTLALTLNAGRLLSFRFNGRRSSAEVEPSTDAVNIFSLDVDGFIQQVTGETSVNYWLKGQNFSEALTFLDKNKVELAAIVPGHTIYEQLPAAASGPILDFTYDAGFTIPVVEDGVYSKKYVRVSDLYAALLNKESEQEDIPELADRLHALEVACDNLCSSSLEDSTDAEAIRLYNVKSKYMVLDISGV